MKPIKASIATDEGWTNPKAAKASVIECPMVKPVTVKKTFFKFKLTKSSVIKNAKWSNPSKICSNPSFM